MEIKKFVEFVKRMERKLEVWNVCINYVLLAFTRG
jgi:hypothetical protein